MYGFACSHPAFTEYYTPYTATFCVQVSATDRSSFPAPRGRVFAGSIDDKDESWGAGIFGEVPAAAAAPDAP